MLDRDACERRVYRLAALLTGNPLAATKVIAQVVDAQPDLGHLDSAHMDRLTVLRSREIAPSSLVSDLVPREMAQALASLTPQQREAFVFGRVYHTPLREMARAMDCSTAATERHVHMADAALHGALGAAADKAASTLLSYSMTLDVPAFHRAARLRRKRMRLAMRVTVLVTLAAIITALVMYWARPFDGQPRPGPAREPVTASEP
jgi:hypothetical protein